MNVNLMSFLIAGSGIGKTFCHKVLRRLQTFVPSWSKRLATAPTCYTKAHQFKFRFHCIHTVSLVHAEKLQPLQFLCVAIINPPEQLFAPHAFSDYCC